MKLSVSCRGLRMSPCMWTSFHSPWHFSKTSVRRCWGGWSASRLARQKLGQGLVEIGDELLVQLTPLGERSASFRPGGT